MEKLDEPKQIPLTFKKTSPIEVALYNHLNKHRMTSRGQYIKNTLIAQMFRENPDMMALYPDVATALKDLLIIAAPHDVPKDTAPPKVTPVTIQSEIVPVMIQEPSNVPSVKEKRNSMSSLLG
ncbi:hypothetical protein [Cellulosilyticum sp. I15G10I2]|uniref:hypothetical protein n=1 Tax=Cellulosilyticum sp. I15G10I2 TaxID=1892843 RepID=UPI00085C501F|nr:hypothetical protein [Cellulosilyticum sp. I15G10I2]